MTSVPENLDRAAYVLGLLNLNGLGPASVSRIALSYPDIGFLSSASHDSLQARFGTRITSAIEEQQGPALEVSIRDYRQKVEEWDSSGLQLLVIHGEGYPEPLRHINDPPPVLFCEGDKLALTERPMAAVVGTRKASAIGLSVARRLGVELSELGYSVVSGLALGIDSAAHQGSTDVGAKAVAVMATKPGSVYPAANRGLADTILEFGGALVTEIPPGVESSRQAFVRRDRIQAGLVGAVFVVETGLVGGTMHTVKFAQTYRRPIYVSDEVLALEPSASNEGIHSLFKERLATRFNWSGLSDLMCGLTVEQSCRADMDDNRDIENQLPLF